jgi:hypothetical protein
MNVPVVSVACVSISLLLGGQILVGRATPFEQSDDNKEAREKFLQGFSEPIRIQESKPVTVNEAQFVLVAQTNWKPGKPGNPNEPKVGPLVAPVEIQLRITNVGKGEVLFPTFQTFGVRILDADGKEVKPRSIRKGETSTRPVILPAGASHSFCPRVELRLEEETKASELVYFDGTGSESVFGPLAPGGYKLVCWYSSSADKEGNQKIGETAKWIGEAVTDEVLINVGDAPTRGFPIWPERLLWDFTEPLRLRQSKPVTINDATFVVAAQTNWKPKKDLKAPAAGPPWGGVPIEIHLRITNLSKKDLLFPTFDTFGLGLTDADGKRIMPRGGRRITIPTKPILLSAGASYSLGPQGIQYGLSRRADLRWDHKTNAAELVYSDGTGTVSYYGPLEPGRNKLTFGYRVSGKGPFSTARDPPTWHGNVVTEAVLIDVLTP